MKNGISKTSRDEVPKKNEQIELKDLEAQIESISKPEPIKESLSPELGQSLPSPINDVKDTISTFLDKIAMAQANREEYIEVSKEVFDHYMRGQKTPYFIYQNIRVYKYGEREAIEQNEARSV